MRGIFSLFRASPDLGVACVERRPPLQQALEQVFGEYEDPKLAHADVARKFRARGFRLFPLVFEAHAGGVSLVVRRLVHQAARRFRNRDPTDPTGSAQIAQRCSVCLQAASARAAVRSLACRPQESGCGAGSASCVGVGPLPLGFGSRCGAWLRKVRAAVGVDRGPRGPRAAFPFPFCGRIVRLRRGPS